MDAALWSQRSVKLVGLLAVGASGDEIRNYVSECLGLDGAGRAGEVREEAGQPVAVATPDSGAGPAEGNPVDGAGSSSH